VSNVPSSAMALLNLIATHESEGAARKQGVASGYDVVWSGIGQQDRPPKPLSTMTVQEVLDWQDGIDSRYNSEAAGRYQVMEDTLRGLVDRGDIDPASVFDKNTQDQIGLKLLQRRGYDAFSSGQMDAVAFGNNLAKEWASFPVLADVRGQKRTVTRGESYYAGDGLNRAGIDPQAVEAALRGEAQPVAGPFPMGPVAEQLGLPAPDVNRPLPGVDESLPVQNPFTTSVIPPFPADGPNMKMGPAPAYRTPAGSDGLLKPYSWFGDLGTSLADSGVVRVGRRIANGDISFPDAGPGWDVAEHIRENGDELDWRFLYRARGPEEYEFMKRELAAERKREARMEAGGRSIPQFLGVLLQPEALASAVMIPGSSGLKVGRSALRIGGASLGFESAAEILRQGNDPNATPVEGLVNVGGAALMGGLLGGAISALTKRQVNQMARGVVEDLASANGRGPYTEKLKYGDETLTVMSSAEYRRRPGSGGIYLDPQKSVQFDSVNRIIVANDDAIARSFARNDMQQLGLADGLIRNADEWREFLIRYHTKLEIKGISASQLRKWPAEVMGPDGPIPIKYGKITKGRSRSQAGGTSPAYIERGNDGLARKIHVDRDRLTEIWKSNTLGDQVTFSDGSVMEGLPQDTFADVEDFIDFVINHELAHAFQYKTGIRDRVNAATFEAGANRIAMSRGGWATGARRAMREQFERLRSEAIAEATEDFEAYRKGPMQRYYNSRIAQAIDRTLDTGYKRVHRNAKTNAAKNLIDRLIGGGEQAELGRAGGGFTQGPSVEMRARIWIGEVDRLKRIEDKLYERNLGFGSNPVIADVPINKTIRTRKADGTPAIEREDFRRRAALVHITGEADPVAEINEFAEAIGKFYGKFENAGRGTGALRSRDVQAAQAELAMEQQNYQNLLKQKARNPDSVSHDELVASVQRMGQLQAEISMPMVPRGEEDYFNRVWSRAAIKRFPKTFRKIVRSYMAANPHVMIWRPAQIDLATGMVVQEAKWERVLMDPNTLDDRVDEMIRGILGEEAYTRADNVNTFTLNGKPLQGQALADALAGQGIVDAVPPPRTATQSGSVSMQMTRAFDAPNKLFAKIDASMIEPDELDGFNGKLDFIETDPMLVGMNYAQRMGAQIEYHRSFADPMRRRNADEGFKQALAEAREAEREAFEGGLGLPPVRPGHTRMFRGEGRNMPLGPGLPPGRYFTVNPSVAAQFGDDIYYVDIPDADMKGVAIDANRAKRDSYIVTEEIAKRKKPVPKGAAIEAAFREHWAPIERDIIHARDRVLNRVVSEPSRLDNRAASFLKDWAITVFLGKTGFVSITDATRIMAAHGFSRTLSTTMMMLDSARRANYNLLAGEAQKAAGVTEITLGISSRRFMEAGMDPVHMNGLERGMRWLAQKSFMLNLLGPISTFLRKMDGVIAQHELAARSLRVADGTASPEDLGWLLSHGIDKKRARAIAKQLKAIDAQPDSDGLYFANTDAWTDEAAVRDFRAALLTHIDNTILVASAADKPNIIDGVMYIKARPGIEKAAKQLGLTKVGDYYRVQSGLLGLPFQFLNFSMAALQKITIPLVENPKGAAISAAIGSLILGYMVQNLRTPSFVWDDLSATDKMARTLDQSGILGLLPEYMWMAQTTSMGAFGVNPLPIDPKFNMEQSRWDRGADILGPAPGLVRDLAIGGWDTINGEEGGIKRMGLAAPLRGHMLTFGLVKDLINWTDDTFGAEGIKY